VESDPEKRVDLGTAIFSEVTDELVARPIRRSDSHLLRDKEQRSRLQPSKERLAGKEIRTQSTTRDEQLALSTPVPMLSRARSISQSQEKALTLQYRVREKILAPRSPQCSRFTTSRRTA